MKKHGYNSLVYCSGPKGDPIAWTKDTYIVSVRKIKPRLQLYMQGKFVTNLTLPPKYLTV